MGIKGKLRLPHLLLFLLVLSTSSCLKFSLFELPRDAYVEEVSVKLENPVQEIEFSDSLKDKIHYDTGKELLTFKGIMSEEEKEELLKLPKLSADRNYGEAIEGLFQKSRVVILAKSKGAAPEAFIKLFTELQKRPEAKIAPSEENKERLVRRDLQDFISRGKKEAFEYLNANIKTEELLEEKLEVFDPGIAITPIVPNPNITPGPKLAFVHLSDVQLHDERVYMFSKELTELLDIFKESFAFKPEMVLFDHAYYLAFIETTQIMCNKLPEGKKPSFMIHSGDALNMGVVSELYEFLYITNHLRIPWYDVLGNHDYPVYGNITSQNVGVIRPNMGFQTVNTRYNFINMHGKGFDVNHLVYFSPDNAPHTETWSKDSVYNGFDMKGRPFWATTSLEKLPEGIPLKDGVSYDATEKLLTYGGSMTKKVRDKLLVLSNVVSYQEAVERLYQQSIEVREDKPCTGCPGYYHFEVVQPTKEGPGILCIVLDTTTPKLLAKGIVQEEQRNWLQGILEDYSSRQEKWMVLVFGHHPLRGEDFFDDSWEEVEKLLLLPKYNAIAYFCGHTHEHEVKYHPNDKYPGSFGFWEVITDSIMEYPKRGSLVTILYAGEGKWQLNLQSFWPYSIEKLGANAPALLKDAKKCFDASKEDAEGKKKVERFKHLEKKHYDAVLRFVFPKKHKEGS